MSPGERLAIRLTVKAPVRVLLLEARPNGWVTQAWPAAGEAPVLLVATTLARPSSSAWPRRLGVPGTTRLRLVVAPVDLDLAALSPADIERAASRLTLVDLTYETDERP